MSADQLALLLVITHTAAACAGMLAAHLVDCQHCDHHHHIED